MSLTLTFPPVPARLLNSEVVGDLEPYTNEARCGPETLIFILRPDNPEIFWDYWALTYVELDLNSLWFGGVQWFPTEGCWIKSKKTIVFTWRGLEAFLEKNQIKSEKLEKMLASNEALYKQ